MIVLLNLFGVPRAKSLTFSQCNQSFALGPSAAPTSKIVLYARGGTGQPIPPRHVDPRSSSLLLAKNPAVLYWGQGRQAFWRQPNSSSFSSCSRPGASGANELYLPGDKISFG